ncbi:MAG TPA: LPP20 family lipoprotein [Bacteroidota bacterium]|nr:LPP20 family lipoprotein [Bacteroidota bacterium]
MLRRDWTGAFVLAVLLACGNLSGQDKLPSWAKNLPNLPQRAGYYQGLGIATTSNNLSDDQKRASDDARAQVAGQIRVSISNKTEQTTKEIMRGDSSDLTKAINEVTQSITYQTLDNLPIDIYLDKANNTLYAYAAISIAEVERQFDERTKSTVAIAQKTFAAAESFRKDGDVASAFGQYRDGLKEIVLTEDILGKKISGDLGTGSMPLRATFSSKIASLLNGLSLSSLGGDNQKAQRNKPLQMSLSGQLMYKKGKESAPVKNIQLRFNVLAPASVDLDTLTTTDEAGFYACTVHNVISGEEKNTIQASIDSAQFASLRTFIPEIFEDIKLPTLQYSFGLAAKTNVVVALQVFETNLGNKLEEPIVNSEIEHSLSEGNYQLVDQSVAQDMANSGIARRAIDGSDYKDLMKSLAGKADYAILGRFSTEQRTAPIPGICFSQASGTAKLIDLKTGQVLYNSGDKSEKGSGNTFSLAGEKGLKTLGVSISADIRTALDNVFK